MFNLKTDPSELSTAQYVNQKFLQVPCTRDVTGDNFPKGQQVYRFEIGGTTWLDMSKSFFRIRATYSRPDGSQLRVADGIAPSMGTAAALFQSLEFRINGTNVSRVADFVSQVDSLETRSTHGRQWLDSVGASSNFYQASFADRQAQIVADAPAPILAPLVASLAYGFQAATTITTAATGGGGYTIVFSAPDAIIPAGSLLQIVSGTDGGVLTITAQTAAASYTAVGAMGGNLAAVPLGAGVLTIAKASVALPPVVAPIPSAAFGFDAATTATVAIAAGTITFSAASPLVPVGYAFSFAGQTLRIVSSNTADNINATLYNVEGATADAGPTPLAAGVLLIEGLANNALLDAQEAGSVELIWQPPLSIFRVDNALPTGQYEFFFNPQINGVYQQRAIESIGTSKTAGTDFNFVINDMYFWGCIMESERVENAVYLLDLMETRCQPQLLNNSASYQQKQYDISPSTVNISLAVQANNAGTDTRLPASMFKSLNGTDLNLTRMMIQYAGQNKPSPDADPQHADAAPGVMGKNWLTQRYAETYMNANLYSSDDSAESLYEWQERGMFHLFDVNRDASDRSTRLITNTQYSPPVLNSNLLAFDTYRVQAQITISQSRVVDVQVSQA